MREMNRFGVTSVCDAGRGWQNYPEDYAVIQQLARNGEMTLRIAYSLFGQNAGKELDDYVRWIGMTRPGEGDDMLRVAGAGENLVASAADLEESLGAALLVRSSAGVSVAGQFDLYQLERMPIEELYVTLQAAVRLGERRPAVRAFWGNCCRL